MTAPVTPAAVPDTRAARIFGIALLAIAAVALTIRVLVITLVDPHVPPLGDASAYHLLANHLADGRGYIRPFDLVKLHLVVPTAEYPPLHPFVLSLLARIGLRSVEAQRLGLAVIGSATVAVVGFLGRRVAGPGVGLVAAGLAAVSPMMFLPEATLMSETIFVFLVTAALVLATRAYDAPTPWRVLALGIVLGLAVLTRAEAAVLGLLLFGGLFRTGADVVPLARARVARRARRGGDGRRGGAVDDSQPGDLPRARAGVEQRRHRARRRQLPAHVLRIGPRVLALDLRRRRCRHRPVLHRIQREPARVQRGARRSGGAPPGTLVRPPSPRRSPEGPDRTRPPDLRGVPSRAADPARGPGGPATGLGTRRHLVRVGHVPARRRRCRPAGAAPSPRLAAGGRGAERPRRHLRSPTATSDSGSVPSPRSSSPPRPRWCRSRVGWRPTVRAVPPGRIADRCSGWRGVS